jgi:nicotinamide mononucleotide adenylyltransferase
MPFAGFKDFDACVKSAAAKGIKSPKSYCAAIQKKVEDKEELTQELLLQLESRFSKVSLDFLAEVFDINYNPEIVVVIEEEKPPTVPVSVEPTAATVKLEIGESRRKTVKRFIRDDKCQIVSLEEEEVDE